MDFCLIIIPRFDITKVKAKEERKNTTKLIFTDIGEFFKKEIKSFLRILINSNK